MIAPHSRHVFQSPFHRGNGCYYLSDYFTKRFFIFQSPFHRGNGCYPESDYPDGSWQNELSVPFSSGQWLLLLGNLWGNIKDKSFSPLFIGAMVATTTGEMVSGVEWYFQSPFHRGNGCYLLVAGQGRRSILAFSPLFIGAMVATVSLMCKP